MLSAAVVVDVVVIDTIVDFLLVCEYYVNIQHAVLKVDKEEYFVAAIEYLLLSHFSTRNCHPEARKLNLLSKKVHLWAC